MSKESRHIILNYLDEPARIYALTYDQAGFAGLSFLSISYFSSAPSMALLVSVTGVVALHYIRKAMGNGFWSKLSYWYSRTRRSDMGYYIPSYVREFIG